MHEEAGVPPFCAKIIRHPFPSMKIRTKRRVRLGLCKAQEGM